MSQRSIEVKVGILMLFALGLLAGFVVIMGGVSFESSFTVYVDFDNPGGLKTGAPVRIAGVKIGRVTNIEFRGGRLDEKTKERQPLIRVATRLETRYGDSLHDDSRWFVTTQGVLGELFLAVDPGSPERPLLKDGAVVHGISPPRLDLLLSEAYELLHRAYLGITENEAKLSETFDGLHQTLKGTGAFFENNGPKLDRIVDNAETLTVQANETLLAARQKYVDNPQIDRILHNVDKSTQTLGDNLDPLMHDGRKVMGDLSRVTDTMASPEQVARYQQITRDVGDIATHGKRMAADGQALVERIKRGQGTVGALVMDEALYDDLQEMLRDLKHNPWKLFWRE